MEDPKVYELLSLMLDEMKESRKDFREGLQALKDEVHDGFRKQEQILVRHEALLQNQANIFTRHLQTTEADQSTRILSIEKRLENLERKVA